MRSFSIYLRMSDDFWILSYKKCVSPIVLIVVVKKRKCENKQWNLHSRKDRHLFLIVISSEAVINEIIRILLNTFSKQERAAFGLRNTSGSDVTVFVPAVDAVPVVALSYVSLARERAVSCLLFS